MFCLWQVRSTALTVGQHTLGHHEAIGNLSILYTVFPLEIRTWHLRSQDRLYFIGGLYTYSHRAHRTRCFTGYIFRLHRPTDVAISTCSCAVPGRHVFNQPLIPYVQSRIHVGVLLYIWGLYTYPHHARRLRCFAVYIFRFHRPAYAATATGSCAVPGRHTLSQPLVPYVQSCIHVSVLFNTTFGWLYVLRHSYDNAVTCTWGLSFPCKSCKTYTVPIAPNRCVK